MNMILFSGPSLSEKEVENRWQGLNYALHPPVRQGDIYKACQKRPDAIGIIDGYFERVPSVWHKEILWAMDQGIHVYGAASMGALRAAELSVYGMQGVGKIFSDFLSEELEDDDEVSIIHGCAEQGYEAYSEAMVSIRVTLQAAHASGIIDKGCSQDLIEFSKKLHYSERSYARVLCAKNSHGEALISNAQTMQKLKQFIDTQGINQKHEDALALIELMAKHYMQGFAIRPAGFVFQYTDNWQQMIDQLAQRQNKDNAQSVNGGVESSVANQTIEDEQLGKLLQKNKIEYQLINSEARFRSMAIQESYRQGVTVTAQMLDEAKHRFCHENNFIINQNIDLRAILHWLKHQQLTMLQFDQLIQDQARVHWYCKLSEKLKVHETIDYLKISGKYQSLIDKLKNAQNDGDEQLILQQ